MVHHLSFLISCLLIPDDLFHYTGPFIGLHIFDFALVIAKSKATLQCLAPILQCLPEFLKQQGEQGVNVLNQLLQICIYKIRDLRGIEDLSTFLALIYDFKPESTSLFREAIARYGNFHIKMKFTYGKRSIKALKHDVLDFRYRHSLLPHTHALKCRALLDLCWNILQQPDSLAYADVEEYGIMLSRFRLSLFEYYGDEMNPDKMTELATEYISRAQPYVSDSNWAGDSYHMGRRLLRTGMRGEAQMLQEPSLRSQFNRDLEREFVDEEELFLANQGRRN